MRRVSAVIAIALGAAVATIVAAGDDEGPSETRTLSSPRISVTAPSRWKPHVGDKAVARDRTLAQRAATRAYDGAPPVMPHSRHFARNKECLDCHQEGIKLGRRYGPPISHAELVNCMQCHVEAANLELPPWAQRIDNSFKGLAAARGGDRVWDGAPPLMPHTTFMRNHCLSCHGPNGYPGLVIDHPQRLNCVQCHAGPAALDPAGPFFDRR